MNKEHYYIYKQANVTPDANKSKFSIGKCLAGLHGGLIGTGVGLGGSWLLDTGAELAGSGISNNAFKALLPINLLLGGGLGYYLGSKWYNKQKQKGIKPNKIGDKLTV